MIVGTYMAPVDKLLGYPGNARRGNIEMIRESLRENGQYKPIVVQKSTAHVLAGNHTLDAAIAEGWTDILATYVDVDDDTARKINLVDNRSNDVAGYDTEALSQLLVSLEGDYAGTGFDETSLSDLLDSLSTAGESAPILEPPAVPTTQLGDVWEMGDHRLICGDSQEPAVLDELLGDDLVALTVTSPPYNQQIDGFKSSGMRKEYTKDRWIERMATAYADSMPEAEYQAQQRTMLQMLFDRTTPDGACFYNHKIRYRDKVALHPVDTILAGMQWRLRQEIVWDRGGSVTLNARMFIPVDERIYWLTHGDRFRFNDTTKIKSHRTVWRIGPMAEEQVTAPFPMELPTWSIEAASLREALVLDPYAGSGTTMIACENLGRRGRMVELDPGYCDVIVARWEKLTGFKAARKGTVEATS